MVAFILPATAAACSSSPRCVEDTDVYLNAGIYTVREGKEEDAFLQDVKVYGLGREDSVLVKGSVSRLHLPLDARQDSCAWVLQGDTWRDTLFFRYRRTTRLLSFECGFIAEFKDLHAESTYHHLDSLAVKAPVVTNTHEENLRLYIDLP